LVVRWQPEAAESYGLQAIEILGNQPSSRAKAMAYSQYVTIENAVDQIVECVHWGEMPSLSQRNWAMMRILSHALNNVGAVQMKAPAYKQKGVALLQQSLGLALKHSYQSTQPCIYQSSSTAFNKKLCFGHASSGGRHPGIGEEETGLLANLYVIMQSQLMLETATGKKPVTLPPAS